MIIFQMLFAYQKPPAAYAMRSFSGKPKGLRESHVGFLSKTARGLFDLTKHAMLCVVGKPKGLRESHVHLSCCRVRLSKTARGAVFCFGKPMRAALWRERARIELTRGALSFPYRAANRAEGTPAPIHSHIYDMITYRTFFCNSVFFQAKISANAFAISSYCHSNNVRGSSSTLS